MAGICRVTSLFMIRIAASIAVLQCGVLTLTLMGSSMSAGFLLNTPNSINSLYCDSAVGRGLPPLRRGMAAAFNSVAFVPFFR